MFLVIFGCSTLLNTFLDYTRDARFQDIKYYFNADMMNVIGRRKFTKILVEDVRKLRND